MAGALLAFEVRSEAFLPDRHVGRAWIALGFAVPLAFAGETVNARWIVFSLTAVAAVSFVYLALFSPTAWLQRALSNRFLVYTGTISYGLYLLHKIPFDMAKGFHVERHPLLALPILLAACYAMAALSWNLLEKPFLRLKRYFPEKRCVGFSRSRQNAEDVLHGVARYAD
jgi:peptidoglycan/LPS O-acetylase OafA/YrhL